MKQAFRWVVVGLLLVLAPVPGLRVASADSADAGNAVPAADAQAVKDRATESAIELQLRIDLARAQLRAKKARLVELDGQAAEIRSGDSPLSSAAISQLAEERTALLGEIDQLEKELRQLGAAPTGPTNFLVRSNYSFTAGYTLSRSDGDFGGEAAHYAFNADINIWECTNSKASCRPGGLRTPRWFNRGYIGLEARVAPVPTEPAPADAEATEEGEGDRTEQVGSFGVSFYSPILGTADPAGRFESFSALIVKGGDSFLSRDVEGSDRSWNFAAGIRVAILEGGGETWSAPRYGGYVDFLYGEFHQYLDSRRWAMELRYGIPETPLLFGVDGSIPVHQETFEESETGKRQKASGSDLRFLVALRVDLEEFLGKIGFSKAP